MSPGGIAHDFNNILTGTLGYLDLLKFHIEHDTKALDLVKKLEAGSRRAHQLIQQILTYSRKTETRHAPFHLTHIIEECSDLIRPGLKQVEFAILRRTTNDEIFGDSTQIHQVLLNLMTNAVQSMDGHGVLEVSVSDGPRDHVLIEVSDTGSGIPQSSLSKIFEPYYTTKPVGLGTGLGLAVVQSIVKNHHGSITVRSQVGAGTTFMVELPVQGPMQPN